MKSVQTLIAKAREKVRTDRELAERLGVKPPELTEMKKGRRPVSPETVAALCDVLQMRGDECREWIAIAMLENPKNADKADLLRRALFASWVLAVCTLSAVPTTDAQAASRATNAGPLCIMSTLTRILARLARLLSLQSGMRLHPCG